VLWQLPPNFSFQPDRLEPFFQALPRTTKEAATLARRHDARMTARAWARAGVDKPIRHALEIRANSFCNPAFISLLRRHRIGLVVADTVQWPLLMDVTADFVYCRLHGSRQLYASGYGRKALADWAGRIHAWTNGKEAAGHHAGSPARPRMRDVYVYFDNDAKVRAPFDAQSLMRKVGM
jgi:uncharacterized protein YecE (DUF72 family)